MKPKEMKRLESYLRQERINESSNGRTLSTRVQMDEKKTYNRQKEKRNLNDSSFVICLLVLVHLNTYNDLLQ